MKVQRCRAPNGTGLKHGRKMIIQFNFMKGVDFFGET